MIASDPFAAKRAAMRDEFFARFFLLGGWLGGTDTYKRTMWAAVPDIALAHAGYSLVMRKGLPEPGADGQLIMAGHEAMLAQWFHRPLRRSDIELARRWSCERPAVRAFPHALWDHILDAEPGRGCLSADRCVGLAGRADVPAGRAVPVLRGARRRDLVPRAGHVPLFRPDPLGDQGPADEARHAARRRVRPAPAPDEVLNIVLLLARYVGGGGRLTSNDTAEFLFPELFRSVGTIGHEMMSAGQPLDRSLAEAEYEMMDRFVSAMGSASLLCDLVDAETVGLINALRVIPAHPETTASRHPRRFGRHRRPVHPLSPRACKQAGIGARTIVFENEVTPETVRTVHERFRKRNRRGANDALPRRRRLLVAADPSRHGCRRVQTHGDGRPAEHQVLERRRARKRCRGYLRVYGQDDALIVADASEPPPGEPLFVKLVEQGRIVYRESFAAQAERADRTWGRYRRIELSPRMAGWQERYRAMRDREVAAARLRLSGAAGG